MLMRWLRKKAYPTSPDTEGDEDAEDDEDDDDAEEDEEEAA